MSNIQHIHLGPESSPFEQGRSAHGRWRTVFQQAAAAADDSGPIPAALEMIQDAERLVFTMAEGSAAFLLAQRLTEFLWQRESANGDWPENLRDWLADTTLWTDAPDGRTGFVCGRLERALAGGRIYLAWLGMNGVRLLKRSDLSVPLDTAIEKDEGWSRTHGPEPVGMALHAYRGSLFGLERLVVVSGGAAPLYDEVPDLSNLDLQQAAADWSAQAAGDLAVFDLRLNPVLSAPNSVLLNYRWSSPDLCDLYWHPSPNATTYRIEEASTPSFSDARLLAELTDNRQVQYRFSPPVGSQRFYRVIPFNQGVPGEPSSAVSPTPMILNTPAMQPVEWSSDGGYHLRWMPVPQATSYEVQASEAPDFAANESTIVYRGERPETFLTYTDMVPRLYFRVRAVNVLYAPNGPSTWSEPVRSPLRLDTPHFTHVSQRRIEWEPVPGARHYVVHVTARDQDEDEGEELFTRETRCGVADQSATYRVRALRQPDDLRTASEWSEPVTIAPPNEMLPGRLPNLRAIRWTLVIATVVALLFGLALGLLGLQAYQDANATSTPTQFPETVLQVTYVAATSHARNATALWLTADAFENATETAAAWTATPSPTATPNATQTVQAVFENRMAATAVALTAIANAWTPTPTATDTPNATLTVEAEFENRMVSTAAALTATAAAWTLTPTATDTPNATLTVEAEFENRMASTAAALTAIAAAWTPTPTATDTPNATLTVEAEFESRLTATAAAWTPTPTPTDTPNATLTVEAEFESRLTATAAVWTPTPTATDTLIPTSTLAPSLTPNLDATIEAELAHRLTATAAAWTPTATLTPTETPTPSLTPTSALSPTPAATATPDWVEIAGDGCMIVNLEGLPLPVYRARLLSSPQLAETVPQGGDMLRRVVSRLASTGEVRIWLQVSFEMAGATITGWVQVPSGAAEDRIYAGQSCPQ